MKVEALPVGPLETSCYIVEGSNSEALVIDPGGSFDLISTRIKEMSLKVVLHVLTHGHFDHVGALAELVRMYPAPVAIHPDDLKWAFEPANSMPPYCPAPERPEMTEKLIDEGDSFTAAGLDCQVLHTPGHSPGSVSLYIPAENVLFAGDVLFAGSIGRTDFPGGSMAEMNESLKRLAGLPGQTVVYPGHGPSTTIDRERIANPFLKGLI